MCVRMGGKEGDMGLKDWFIFLCRWEIVGITSKFQSFILECFFYASSLFVICMDGGGIGSGCCDGELCVREYIFI